MVDFTILRYEETVFKRLMNEMIQESIHTLFKTANKERQE